MPNSVIINKKIKTFKKKIYVSSDKSLSIRCILLAAQAIGVSKVSNLLESEDVLNALKAIKKLGINYSKKKNIYKIYGFGLNSFDTKKKITINAGNSGTLGRLLIGLCARSKNKITIIGDKSLSRRDFSRVTNPIKNFGTKINSKKNCLPVYIEGTEFLRPINYIENKGSAQCKSAVMLAALNAPGITKIKAKKSRNHTELLFKYLKIPIKIKSNKNFDEIEIKGLNEFKSFNYEVPGDISSSAFFIVLTLLSKKSNLIIKKVNINKTRLGIVKILNKMNAKIKFFNKRIYNGEEISDIYIKSANNLKSINCPANLNSSAIDEFLVIFLVAARAKGISTFKKLNELNKKESPRLDISINFLKMIGIKVLKHNDNIKIYGNPNLDLKGNYYVKNFFKDHRVFMMSCIAALVFGGNWKIYDRDSINTSFPKFLTILKTLGARIF